MALFKAEYVEQELPAVRALRHELHGMPELGFQEKRTQARLVQELTALGLKPRRLARTGLLVDTRPGEPIALALRADMDALPLDERTDLSYRSRNAGRMHACGHDGHMAILVGVARVLLEAGNPVNVRLLFQPAEEGEAGAVEMIHDGALDGVPELYALHNWPGLALGRLAVRDGPMMASSAEFEVVFRGRGGHGSQPERCRDPVVVAGQFITSSQAILGRQVSPFQPAVVSICVVHGGTAHNIIPDEVRVGGTVRTLDDGLMRDLESKIHAVARAVAMPTGVEVEWSFDWRYPVTVNHSVAAGRVRQAAERVLGQGALQEDHPPSMGAEDFSFYLQRVPGAIFFLGADSVTGSPGLHTVTFDFNDALLAPGIRLFLDLVEQAVSCPLAGTSATE